MRIIFAGTPEIALPTLSSLIHWSRDPEFKKTHGFSIDLLAAYTQPDRPQGRGQQLTPSPIKKLALAENIPVETPLSFKLLNNLETFKNYKADLLIVLAYGLILPLDILNSPTHGGWNIHVSLLPRWRGAAPIQRAIQAGDKFTGISLMQMDAGLDTGDILLTETCEIKNQDTSQTLHDKLAQLSPEALLKGLKLLNQNLLVKKPQTDNKDNKNNKITYAKKLEKSESSIRWSDSACKISCQIRAFNPYPIASGQLGEFIIRIHEAVMDFNLDSTEKNKIKNGEKTPPGKIIEVNKLGITVACGPEGQERITLTKIQFPNGKILSAHEAMHSRQALFNNYIFLTPPI